MKVGDLVRVTFREGEDQGVILSIVEKTYLPNWLTGGKQTYMVYCINAPLKIHELRDIDLKLLSEA